MAGIKEDDELMNSLIEPFDVEDIEWRIQQSGISAAGNPWAMVLAYITNRAIQERLDLVCGPLGWKNEFMKGPDGGVVCGLSILNKLTSEWVTKYDGADNTDIEGVKGGLSGSMKRAGAQWGIGRYLYNLEVAFADCLEVKTDGYKKHFDKKSGKSFFWKSPRLPVWATPRVELEPGSEDWRKVYDAIAAGKATLSQALDKFKINKNLREELQFAQDNIDEGE